MGKLLGRVKVFSAITSFKTFSTASLNYETKNSVFLNNNGKGHLL